MALEREIGIHDRHGDVRRIAVEKAILTRNDELAASNRARFTGDRLLVVNLVSGPGAGKTELLARTGLELQGRRSIGVIVGDLATDRDAARLRRAGVQAVQITTGGACHLDAAMVAEALERLEPGPLDLLVIENVGNLVCPAAWDLGESLRVVMMAVTDGEDKPLKYPTIFKSADLVLLSKCDLADAVGFDRGAALANLAAVAPGVPVVATSARTDAGVQGWIEQLETRLANAERPRLVAE